MGNEPNTQQGQIDAWKSECEARSRAELRQAMSNAGSASPPMRQRSAGSSGGSSRWARLFWLAVIGLGAYLVVHRLLAPVSAEPCSWIEPLTMLFTTARHHLLGRRRLRRPELPRRPRIYQGRRRSFVVTGRYRSRQVLGLIRTAAIWIRLASLWSIVVLAVSLYIPPSAWTTWTWDLQDARRAVDAVLLQGLGWLLTWSVTEPLRPWAGYLIVGDRLHSGVWVVLWFVAKFSGSLAVGVLSRPSVAWLLPRRLTVKITPTALWVWRWGVVPWRLAHRSDVPVAFRMVDLPPKATVVDRPMSSRESTSAARRQRILADTARIELIYGSRRIVLGEVLSKAAAERFVVCLEAARAMVAEHRNTISTRPGKSSRSVRVTPAVVLE